MIPKLKQIKVNIPGYTPDWTSLIQNDPTYHQFHLDQLAQSARDQGLRNQSFAQGLIHFGAIPDFGAINMSQGGMLGDFGINQATRDAIAANTQSGLSQTAQMAHGHDVNVQSLQDMLAARGILQSGSLGVGLGQEQSRYASQQASTRQQLLDLLAGLQKAFADAEAARSGQNATQLGATADRLQASGLYKPRDATTVKAVRDPVTGLYRDASGNYYDAAGNPTNPQAQRVKARLIAQIPHQVPPHPYYGGGGV